MVGLTRHQRRIAARIACFAVLLASLAPSISHALVAAGLSNVNPVSLASWSGLRTPRLALAPAPASQVEGLDPERMPVDSISVETMVPGQALLAATQPVADRPNEPDGGGHYSHHQHQHQHQHQLVDASASTRAPQLTSTAILQGAASPDTALSALPALVASTPVAHLAGDHTPASHSPSSHSPAMHFEHCPFCFTHAGSFGLPFVATIVIPTVTATTLAPVLFYRAPRPLFAWSVAQPRAPPYLS
jgi:hypothetical protein